MSLSSWKYNPGMAYGNIRGTVCVTDEQGFRMHDWALNSDYAMIVCWTPTAMEGPVWVAFRDEMNRIVCGPHFSSDGVAAVKLWLNTAGQVQMQVDPIARAIWHIANLEYLAKPFSTLCGRGTSIMPANPGKLCTTCAELDTEDVAL